MKCAVGQRIARHADGTEPLTAPEMDELRKRCLACDPDVAVHSGRTFVSFNAACTGEDAVFKPAADYVSSMLPTADLPATPGWERTAALVRHFAALRFDELEPFAALLRGCRCKPVLDLVAAHSWLEEVERLTRVDVSHFTI